MRTSICGYWSQDWGRDTHICRRYPGHSGPHACNCMATWTGPDRNRHAHRWRYRRRVFWVLLVAAVFAALIIAFG